MNSLNKHTPTIVFVIGLALLIFSVRTFFNPSGGGNMTPIVNKNLPAAAPASGPTVRQDDKRAPTIVFRPASKPPPVINRNDPKDEFQKELKKPAQNYLSKVGLKMNIPDGYAFAEETDGAVEVLVGASEPGKSDFYFFTAKGKYPVDKANAYIKSYFGDESPVTPKGNPQSFYSRGGFSDMSQMRGNAGKSEYQAYFFTNPKANHTHLVMIMNRAIIKAPAKVRELIDSISRSGR